MTGVPLTLDFRLEQGAFALEVCQHAEVRTLALFGPSGSGKTTVLEVIAGLRRPSAGRVVIGEQVVFDKAARVNLPPRARGVGYVPQDALLFPHLNVRHNIFYGSRRARGAAADRVVEILELAPLIDRRVRGLSGGERQRVALARALVSAPALLLLDEPLAGVDRPLRQRILPYLKRVRDELRVPMIYVTHDADEARALANSVIVLEAGTVVRAGTTELLE